jgi:hypothetical protein
MLKKLGGGGPYQGQPSSWLWQVAWDNLPAFLPFYQAPLWDAPRKHNPVLPPEFRFMVDLLVGFALGKQVIDYAWQVVSQNLRPPVPPDQPWVDPAMEMLTPVGQHHTIPSLLHRSLARARPGGQELGWW